MSVGLSVRRDAFPQFSCYHLQTFEGDAEFPYPGRRGSGNPRLLCVKCPTPGFPALLPGAAVAQGTWEPGLLSRDPGLLSSDPGIAQATGAVAQRTGAVVQGYGDCQGNGLLPMDPRLLSRDPGFAQGTGCCPGIRGIA